jgi:hypothetical protein
MNQAAIPQAIGLADVRLNERGDAPTAGGHAVSWPAIVAGAVGAAALSLILLILGVGLGLSSVSPWSGEGIAGATFGVSTIVWLTFTQLAASGIGGYLAGRLRTRWSRVHTDEVFFRDTAHGFLAWALATLFTAAMLASATGSVVGAGAQAVAAGAGRAAAAGGGFAAAAAAANPTGGIRDSRADAPDAGGYFVDSLFRKDANATTPAAAPTGAAPPDMARSDAEVGRIFATGMSARTMSTEDTRYAAQIVAQRTGLSQADAERRVTETFTRAQQKAKDLETAAREAADKARKATAYGALWMFVSLLVGAFVASLSATFGGRTRDYV